MKVVVEIFPSGCWREPHVTKRCQGSPTSAGKLTKYTVLESFNRRIRDLGYQKERNTRQTFTANKIYGSVITILEPKFNFQSSGSAAQFIYEEPELNRESTPTTGRYQAA